MRWHIIDIPTKNERNTTSFERLHFLSICQYVIISKATALIHIDHSTKKRLFKK